MKYLFGINTIFHDQCTGKKIYYPLQMCIINYNILYQFDFTAQKKKKVL